MSERYTRKDAEAAFRRLCKVTGHQESLTYSDHRAGDWVLDYTGCYGGFVIEEYLDTDTGRITHPLGSERRTTREFCDAVRFAIRAIEALETSNMGRVRA